MIAIGGIIGTGLFVGTGQALALTDPLSLFLAYALICFFVYGMMTTVITVGTYFPLEDSSMAAYASRYYALGIVIAYEITAASIVINYWPNNVHIAVWLTILLVVIVGLNLMPVKIYAESEFRLVNNAGLISWICCYIVYLRFNLACKVQGITKLPYNSIFQPYVAWFNLVFFTILLLLNGFSVFFPGHWSVNSFLTAYIGIPAFLVPYIGHRIVNLKDPWAHSPEEVDMKTSVDEMEAMEEEDAALHWLTPNTGDGENSQSVTLTTPPSRTIPLRSQIPAVPPESVLPLHRVEDILRIIDSLDASSNVPGDNVSINLHNFGVFDLGWGRTTPFTPSESPAYLQCMPASPLDPELWNHTAIQYSGSPDVPADAITAGITPPANPGGGVSPSCSETAAAWDLCRLHHQSAPVVAVDLEPLENVLLTNTSDSAQYRCHMSRASVSSMIQSPQGSWPTGNESCLGSPMATPVSSPVTKQERFLLYHYMHRVVHLFSVIDNAKTPWKTIHLPRALQCIGELSIAGSTSRIRDALTRTLLSISAFSLSNDCKARSRIEEASQWEDSATRFRGDAIGLLKQAVETDLYSGVRPRYKEFLATMLSMITINVMSGETSTCGVHLDGAEQLIKHMSIRKRRFSKKAKSLHRIYYYLRVIYESTAWARQNSSSRFSTLLSLRGGSDPDSIDVFYHDSCSVIETPMSASSIHDNPAIEMDTYEFIYGLPQRLLILLKETIELIGLVDDARGKSGSSFIPEELSISCDELERNIFLESIEAIENIKTQTNTLAAPLFWPAFIAATEAFDKAHQERFRTWHNAVEVPASAIRPIDGPRHKRQHINTPAVITYYPTENSSAWQSKVEIPVPMPAQLNSDNPNDQPQALARWIGEFTTLVLSILFEGVLIVILVWMDGKPYFENWRAPLFINTVAAILTTVSNTALMHSVGSTIGQVKWIDYQETPQKLGIVWLPRSILVLGAFVTVLGLGVGPFTQQVVQLEEIEVKTTDPSLKIDFAVDYNTFPKQSALNTPTKTDVATRDPSIRAAIMKGVFGIGSSPDSCENTTQATAETKICSKSGSKLTCNMTTPSGIALSTNRVQNTSATILNLNTTWSPDFLNTTSNAVAPSDLLKIGVFRSTSGHDHSYNGEEAIDEDVIECTLSLIMHQFEGIWSNSTFNKFGLITAFPLGPGYWANTQNFSGAPKENNLNSAFFYNTTADGQPLPVTIALCRQDLINMLEFFDLSSFRSDMVSGTPSTESGIGVALINADIPAIMRTMADGMSQYVRAGTNNRKPANGFRVDKVVFVNILWQWMVLPLFVHFLAIIFVLWVIRKNHLGGIPLWRSSALELILHDYDKERQLLVTPDYITLETGAKQSVTIKYK
ncbi:hypothetical protein GQX73_g6597 [Xylaria multiplex]|uniref:Amino acid permease/ SLC12A domain-containing protein n=1 Tax=Xylaria multiplex TaxID=323545 RepID=A0A7C8IR81_9PEZI|nr:hypothetical protein GQX73_g6597 [Xylaria multiplex]